MRASSASRRRNFATIGALPPLICVNCSDGFWPRSKSVPRPWGTLLT